VHVQRPTYTHPFIKELIESNFNMGDSNVERVDRDEEIANE